MMERTRIGKEGMGEVEQWFDQERGWTVVLIPSPMNQVGLPTALSASLPVPSLPGFFPEFSNSAPLFPADPFTWNAYLQKLKSPFLASPTKEDPRPSIRVLCHILLKALNIIWNYLPANLLTIFFNCLWFFLETGLLIILITVSPVSKTEEKRLSTNIYWTN